MNPQSNVAESVALNFARTLARRDFDAAWAMCSDALRSKQSRDDLKAAFESIVPADWGPVDPIEIATTMDDWPGKEATGVKWVYISLGGQVYSEAVVVIVGDDSGLRICGVEWGRP